MQLNYSFLQLHSLNAAELNYFIIITIIVKFQVHYFKVQHSDQRRLKFTCALPFLSFINLMHFIRSVINHWVAAQSLSGPKLEFYLIIASTFSSSSIIAIIIAFNFIMPN